MQVVVSPTEENGSLFINQDAWLSMIELEEGCLVEYKMHQQGNGAYCFILDGELNIASENLAKRDAIGLWECDTVSVEATKNSKMLFIEVPMN